MITVAIYAAFILLIFAARTVALKIGAHLARSNCATLSRSVLATLAIFLAGLALNIISMFAATNLASGIIFLLLSILLDMLLISLFFKLTFPRAALAWLPSLAFYVLSLLGVYFLFFPYVAQAYVIPNAGMAPTIINAHYTTQCPKCGGELLVPALDPRLLEIFRERKPDYGICQKCFASSPVDFAKIPQNLTNHDRVIVTKFLNPNRLDIIAFRVIHGDIWTKRLIGLPGETVEIVGGKIHINGSPLALPPDLAQIDFSGHQFSPPEPTHLTLAPDEYFVLGDDPVHSSDSRYSGPIKKSNLVGVVTATYFPLSRFRIFR